MASYDTEQLPADACLQAGDTSLYREKVCEHFNLHFVRVGTEGYLTPPHPTSPRLVPTTRSEERHFFEGTSMTSLQCDKDMEGVQSIETQATCNCSKLQCTASTVLHNGEEMTTCLHAFTVKQRSGPDMITCKTSVPAGGEQSLMHTSGAACVAWISSRAPPLKHST